MALGKIKRVPNRDQKFGANDSYLFVKVQASWNRHSEEYLLLSDQEFLIAAQRARKNPEDNPSLPRGHFTRVDNTQRKFGADPYYIAFTVVDEDGNRGCLMFTEEGLERIRERVTANAEDIEANKTGWLADLFD